MKKLAYGQIYSFSSQNIIAIDLSIFTSILIIGFLQGFGGAILACSVNRENNIIFKIIDLVNLTEFNSANWTTSIENNQLIFRTTKLGSNSGIILRSF